MVKEVCVTKKNWTTEDKTRRWEYHREIKNLMGKYMFSLLLNKEKDMFDMFWSQTKPDVCLGFNNGWYSGAEAIKGYYAAVHENTVRTSYLMRELFPQQLGGKTDEEIFGAGPFNIKPMSNAVIEISGDEETAKGMWYSRGSYVKVGVSGPVSYWTFGCYCVDFVLEDGKWRIWHMMNLEDIDHISGQDWTKPDAELPPLDDFKTAVYPLPEPNVPAALRELYTPGRKFTKLPDFPEPYEKFQDTFSYGM